MTFRRPTLSGHPTAATGPNGLAFREDACTNCGATCIDPVTHERCMLCLGTGRVCVTAPLADPPRVQARGADEPPPHDGVPPEVREARESGLSAIKRAAVREIETGRGDGAALDHTKSPGYEPVLPGTQSPRELASALGMAALRRLEKGMNDFDPRVSFEAARVIGSVAVKMADLPPPPGADVSDPVARRAALVAALATPAVIEIVRDVVRSGGPLRASLEADGWVHEGRRT